MHPSSPPTVATHGKQLALEVWLPWAAALCVVELVFLSAAWLAPRIAIAPELGFVLGFSAVSASTVAAAATCPLLGKGALPIAALVLVASLVGVAALGSQGLLAALATTAALLVGATLIGNIIGAGIQHAGQLVFVAVVSSAADLFSVFHPSGPSAAIVQSEAALSLATLPWPLLGTAAIIPLLGGGDVAFTALYLAAARRHGLGLGRTIVALGVGYAATLGAVLLFKTAIPALPFLGMAFVAVHPAARQPKRADRTSGLIISCGVVAAVTLLLLLKTS